MSPQPGRNDPCPCGSGKKYKKCCGEAKGGSTSQEDLQAELGRLAGMFHNQQYDEVEMRANLLLKRFPNQGLAWKILGTAMGIQGKDALPALQRAAMLLPNDADVQSSLGNAYSKRREYETALACFGRALAIRPHDPDVHNNLGITLKQLGRFDSALASFKHALELNPRFAQAQHNLGNLLQDLGQLKDAVACYQIALSIKPSNAGVLNSMGMALHALGRIEDAQASYQRALELRPHYAKAHNNLAMVLLELNQFAASVASYRRALELDPGDAETYSNLLFALNYSPSISGAESKQEACSYGRMTSWKAGECYINWNCMSEPSRLRVGLVSGDLRNHPVGYFLESLLKALDPGEFELIAYPSYGMVDELSERIKGLCVAWRPIYGLDDGEAAQLIHNDGIHVLLDLSGHTAHNRLPVFAWKPAPVLVSWLGYFATTGVAEMDYILADRVGVPEDQRGEFTETIWYLPDTRLCFTPPHYALSVAPLPAQKNGYITFGCFQNLSKLGDAVLVIWARILAALPSARLRVANKPLGDPMVATQFRQRLQQHGIAPGRVDLHGSVSREAYLAAHGEVDVVLDTFPYPGGTTTCEALWMGVPTLTLAGKTLLSRQGASLLTAAGLGDWIARSEDEYVEKAIQFTKDLPKLAVLRAGLRQQVLISPLFDAPRFARNFETALWGMWRHGHDQQHAHARKLAYETSLPKLEPNIEIVSATRLTEDEFWSKSALGVSLRRLALDTRIVAHITFENRRGLPELFNARIHAQDSQEILVFVHDDVWIDDYAFADHIMEGLKAFDVIGVAGNRRRVRNQSGWKFIDEKFTSDDQKNLSGRIAHGNRPYGVMSIFGEAPADCELLDGVFMATKKSQLKDARVTFDPRFNFHFYDLDFCRSAREQGLHLGTWPISLTHQSEGSFGSAGWRESYRLYLDKWEDLGKE